MVNVVVQLLAGSCFVHQVSPRWWVAIFSGKQYIPATCFEKIIQNKRHYSFEPVLIISPRQPDTEL